MYSPEVNSNHAWLRASHADLALYNTYDTVATARLATSMGNLLEHTQQTKYWAERFWTMVPVIRDMVRRGVGVLDRGARNKYRSDLRAELQVIDDGIWEHVKGEGYQRDTFFNSPQQLARCLYDDWGLRTPPPTRQRKVRSTSLEAIGYVIDHLRKKDEPLRGPLNDLFHRSRLQTNYERYSIVEGDEDGRVRPMVKLGGTETMRLAYSGGPGEAIQQWPMEARHLIRARPGHLLLGRDYSQLEARILAVLAHDELSLRVFADPNGDVHTANALDLFGYAPAAWAAMDGKVRAGLRNFAKTFLYGLSYGASSTSLKVKVFCGCYRAQCVAKRPPQVNLARSEIVAAAERWESIHAPIMLYRRNLLDSIKGNNPTHTYRSPFDFNRIFFEPRNEAARSIYNFPMQHSGAEIINGAMRRLHGAGAPLVLQMHDELVLEVPAAQVGEWDERLREAMEAPVPELGGAVFPTSGHVGETWADLK